MPAFSFKPEFADKIESGQKLSTIRQTQRCKVGDTMYLYVGMRTKKCRLLKKATCIGTGEITITERDIWKIYKTRGEVKHKGMFLHEQEGFKNAREFFNFFKSHYGLPFTGWIHVWDKGAKP